MNLIAHSPTWLAAILIAFVAAAAVEDAVRLRISNVTCLGVLLAALVAMALQGFPLALWQNAVVFVAILAVGTAVFAAGKMGGGDIKLLACLGLWMSFGAAVWFIASTLIAGGVLALGFIGARVLSGHAVENARAARNRRIPYGLAIAAGASLVFAGQLGLMKSRPNAPDPFSVQPFAENRS
jgi:prepilin peptidase CpaA